MSENGGLLNRVKAVGNWLADKKNSSLIAGIGFSILHATVNHESPSEALRYLGYASLGLNSAILGIRYRLPQLNEAIANKVDGSLEKLKMPSYNSNGAPLFLNGIFLGGMTAVSAITLDVPRFIINGGFFLANTTVGAQMSGNSTYTTGNWGKNAFNAVANIKKLPTNLKTTFKKFAEQPPNFLKYTLYLPEFSASLAAFTAATQHSGAGAVASGVFSALAVGTAIINSGDTNNPNINKLPIIGKIADKVSSIPIPDFVWARSSMVMASFGAMAGAYDAGNIGPMVGHGGAVGGNAAIANAARQTQLENLEINNN